MLARCKNFFVFLFLLESFVAFSQSIDTVSVIIRGKVDELNGLARKYEESSSDSMLLLSKQALRISYQSQYDQGIADAYMNMANYFVDNHHSNWDSTTFYFQKVLDIHFANQDSLRIGKAFYDLSQTYYINDNYPLALNYATRARETFEKQTKGATQRNLEYLANTLSLICEINNYMSNNEIATRNCIEALKLFNELSMERQKAPLLKTMGSVHYDLKDYEKAQEYLQRSVLVSEKYNLPYNLSSAYIGLGEVELALTDYEEALEYFNKALALDTLSNDSTGTGGESSYAYYSIGKTYVLQEKNDEALQMLEKSIIKANIKSDQLLQAKIFLELGKVNYNLTQLDSTINYLNQSKAIAEKIQASSILRECYLELAKYYNRIGDLENALVNFRLIILIDEKLFAEQNAKQIAEIETLYDVENLDKEIQILKQENEIQKLNANERRIINYSLVAGIMLVTMLVVVFYYQSRRRQKINKELEQKNEAINQQKLRIELQNSEITQKSNLLEENSRNITDSILYAKKIQLSLLPDQHRIKDFFPNSFVFFRPKDIVSGDFYWLANNNNQVIIATLDCTGHGVPGAFMTVLANSLLNQLVLENKIYSPDVILSLLDSRIKQALHQQNGDSTTITDGMDIAVCQIDLDTLNIVYCGAKMPVFYTQNDELFQLNPDRYSLGGTEYGEKEFKNKCIHLEKGDMFYMASDGFQDQFGGVNDKKFMRKKFRDLLGSIYGLETTKQSKKIEEIYDTWKGNQVQTDDVMIIGIRL